MISSPRRGWEFPGGQIEVGETILEGLQREIYEETGVQASVNHLVGIYSNIKPPTKVIFGFRCAYISGKPRPSRESPEVAWFSRNQVLEIITHPAIYDRMKDLLDFDGCVIYRVYTTDPYQVHSTQFM